MQIAVLAGLAATGTLATNILLPSLPQMAASLHVTSCGGDLGHYRVPRGLRAMGSSSSDRYRIATAGAGQCCRVCGVLCRQHLVRAATDLSGLLIGRVIQAAGACATSVLSRAIACDMFSGEALARAMALIMIAMAAAPGFSPLLGGALDHYFDWRSEFVLAVLPGSGPSLMPQCSARPTTARTALDPLAIARNYPGLIADRRFVMPATTVKPDHGRVVRDMSRPPPAC